MKDFIIGLYSNDNFPIYLGLVILVLVILFLVVFYYGKKDKKKIEQTLKMQKIKDDAFKETSQEEKVEAIKEKVSLKEDEKKIDLPLIDEKDEKIDLPLIEEKEEIDFLEEEFIDTLEIEMPKLIEEKEEEIKVPDFKKIADDLENEIQSLEKIKEPKKQPKVFSSVYVPKKEIVLEDTDEVIELPKLK